MVGDGNADLAQVFLPWPTVAAENAPVDIGLRPSAMIRCSKCKRDVEPGEHGRCLDCGAFVSGNAAALLHGVRNVALGRETVVDTTRRLEIRDAVFRDLGGRDRVSTTLAELVEDFARAVVLRDLAFDHLAAVGPLSRGRRRAVVGLYFEASARAEKLAVHIGLTRRERRVPSPADYLEGQDPEAS
jgi:hypothetical protein